MKPSHLVLVQSPFCKHEGHPEQAEDRAAACTTCSDADGREDHPVEPCIDCGVPIAYYSCAPGRCVLCAHDPCWVPFSELYPGEGSR